MAKTHKEEPQTPMVIETLRDPLLIASEARLLKERLESQGGYLRRLPTSPMSATTQQQILTNGPGAIQHWHHELRVAMGGVVQCLTDFEQTVAQARQCLTNGRQVRAEKVILPAQPSLVDLDQARVNTERFRDTNNALNDLELTLKDWEPVHQILRRDIMLFLEATTPILYRFEDELDLMEEKFNMEKARRAKARRESRQQSGDPEVQRLFTLIGAEALYETVKRRPARG